MITVPESVLSNIRRLLALAHRAGTEAERNRLGRAIDRDAITYVSMALRTVLVDITIGLAPSSGAANPLKSFDLAMGVLDSVSNSSLPALLRNAKKALIDASGEMRPFLVAIGGEQFDSTSSPRRMRRRASQQNSVTPV